MLILSISMICVVFMMQFSAKVIVLPSVKDAGFDKSLQSWALDAKKATNIQKMMSFMLKNDDNACVI